MAKVYLYIFSPSIFVAAKTDSSVLTASENKMKVVAALSSQSIPKHTSAYQSFHIRMLQQFKIYIIYVGEFLQK